MIAIGSRVKTMQPVDGKGAVQFETGRVIYIGRRLLIEYEKNICGHNGNGLGKNRFCWMVDWDKIKEI
jgi:hypothetical protein